MRSLTKNHLRVSLVVIGFFAFAGGMMAQSAQTKPLPKQISGGVLNGKATSLPKPEYPAAARAEKASGPVSVQVLIDEAGNVVSAKAASGSENVSLRLAAETAAMQAKFSPTLLAGNPVKVSGVITYNFVPQPENHEKEMTAFMASMLLNVIKDVAADPERFEKALNMDAGELRSILKEAAADPEFPGLEILATLEKTAPAKRAEVIETALSSMRGKLDPADQLKFELGKAFGDAVGPMLLLAIDEDPDISKVDVNRIKRGLTEMKRLISTAPSESLPKAVADSLKNLASLADREDLFSETGTELYSKRVEAVFTSISPDFN